MGIAKYYYTQKQSGKRIDSATLKFFGEKQQEATVKPKVENIEKPKKKEDTVADILKNLLEE